jgi:hypothetical protein
VSRLALSLALTLSLASVAGCTADASLPLWRDGFETTCDGAPCGWTQVAGTAGAVTWIETVPGEHGVHMAGDGVAISRDVTDENLPFQDSVDTLEGHFVARCDRGAHLTLLVSLQNASGGMPIDTSGTAPIPETFDGSRVTFGLFASDPALTSAQFSGVLGVVIHKEGPGACDVDYVSLGSAVAPFRE